MNDRDRFVAAFLNTARRGTGSLEWAILRGRLAKLWPSASLLHEPANPTPEDERRAAEAFDQSMKHAHASGVISIENGKITDIVVTEKQDLPGAMREPRRP